jgi:hypothetical protein
MGLWHTQIITRRFVNQALTVAITAIAITSHFKQCCPLPMIVSGFQLVAKTVPLLARRRVWRLWRSLGRH